MSNKVNRIGSYEDSSGVFDNISLSSIAKNTSITIALQKRVFFLWQKTVDNVVYYCWKNFCNNSSSIQTGAVYTFLSEVPDSSYPVKFAVVNDYQQNDISITFIDEDGKRIFSDYGPVANGNAVTQNYNMVPAAIIDLSKFFES